MYISIDINEKTGKVKIDTTFGAESRTTNKVISKDLIVDPAQVHLIAETMPDLLVKKQNQINVKTTWQSAIDSIKNQNPYMFDEKA